MILEGLLVLGAGGVVSALRKRRRAKGGHEASNRSAGSDHARLYDEAARRQARQNAHNFAQRTQHTIQSNNATSQRAMSNFMSGMQHMNRPHR